MLNVIPKQRERAPLAFKVALGSIGAFIEHSIEDGTGLNYLFESVKAFMQKVLIEV